MQRSEPDFSRRLNVSLRARVTLIVVITPEEERVVEQIKVVCERWDPPRQCIAWDSVEGFSVIVGNKNFLNQSRDPLTALDDLVKTGEDAVIVLKDFHEYWNNPPVKRRIRNFSQAFRYNRRHDRDRHPDTPGAGRDPRRGSNRAFPPADCSRAFGRPRHPACHKRHRLFAFPRWPGKDHPGRTWHDPQPGTPGILESHRDPWHAR